MGNKVILKATDLDSFLKDEDKKHLEQMGYYYREATEIIISISNTEKECPNSKQNEKLISVFNKMGDFMKQIISTHPQIRVYSFDTPVSIHGETSRLIAKLRDTKTKQREFLYYIQRAYELFFNPAVFARDRLNSIDEEDYPRNIIQLIADYGTTISDLYRAQIRKIEETVLTPKK